MKFQRLISAVLITSMLAGCNPPPHGAGQQTGGIAKQDIGAVLGAVGGGVIGSTMGKGRGQIATTIAGAMLGGMLGNSLGKSLDQADAAYYNQATQSALETIASSARVTLEQQSGVDLDAEAANLIRFHQSQIELDGGR